MSEPYEKNLVYVDIKDIVRVVGSSPIISKNKIIKQFF